MGKGAKKKTVWRTFSFENGYTNGDDVAAAAGAATTTTTITAATATRAAADTTNGLTGFHHQKNENGNHDVTNRTSITNGKLVNSWRIQRCTDDNAVDGDDDATDANDTDSNLHHTNGNDVMNGYTTENGHRSYFKRSTHSDYHNKYPLRMNGLRKASAYFQENGANRSEFHDIYDNSTQQHSQFRSNRLSKPSTSRYANYRKWDNRNGSFSLNGNTSSSNYSRGFRKSHFVHSDEEMVSTTMTTTTAAATAAATTTTTATAAVPTATASNEFINHIDEHFHEAKNARNAGDSDKCHDNTSDGKSTQQLHDQTDQRRGKQQNKFNEDEYTRISTPRSEVLFKKGYLMRDRKYVGPTNTISTAATSSSNDSGSVSVISNEETASYYSIQSMSPDDSNSTYLNGNSSSTDSNSATYPNDGFEHDLSLIYSSGFYDNSGYFYVNPYIHNNFDQFNGPTILMPYGSAPTKDIDAYDADAYPQTSLSPGTGDGKSVDSEHANNFSSINSEEMSNSSLSINNDSDTPPNPLTPPPSPLSPNEKPISRAQLTETESSNTTEAENDSQNTAAAPDGETIPEPIAEFESAEVPEVDAVVPTDNYPIPYFSPLIFVPPIPFVPDARMANSRRGKFRRYLNNQYGRSRRNNRFSHFYNKIYIPSNWSEAPDEAAPTNANEDNVVESSDKKPVEGTPTIEQCDKILKNSKLNLNVSEFIPQSKRMIFVPLSIASSPPAPLYFVPIPSTESTLNVNVPEFLPKNYKPLCERFEENEQCTASSDKNNDKIDHENEDDDDNNNNHRSTNENNRNGELTSLMVINGDDATTVTNESAKNQNNETTINDRNDLSSDAKNTKYTPPKGTPTKKTTLAAVVEANGVRQSRAIMMTRKVANLTSKHNGDAVSNMSDLLKTNNSDNFNLDACSFNKENNSHTNLKADLGNKNIITYDNKSKNVYKNDNHQYSDSGSNKAHKQNNNRNAKTRHAYPKTKETSNKQEQQQQQLEYKPLDEQPELGQHQQKTLKNKSLKKTDQPADCNVGDQKMTENPSNSVEKSSRTYAQMVVPKIAKNSSITTTMIKTPPEMIDTPKRSKSPSNSPSKSLSLTSKDKSAASINHRIKSNHPSKKWNNNRNKKDDAKRKPDVPEKPLVEGAVEWFTIDAKGKKHAAPNGSTVTEIAFENESNIEKVNKIAEELLLDINRDADLAMDIMDSLIVSTGEKQSSETKTKVMKKKKPTIVVNKLKKKSKEKLSKEQQKRRDTFDIIEPNFGQKTPIESELVSNETESNNQIDAAAIDDIENDHITTACGDLDESPDDEAELIFDPNVFATPCNLQMDSHQHSPTIVGSTLSKSLRLSGGKMVRNLINQFDIYQPEFTSYENQQLKQEEEMVIKVLQQLNNKSVDVSEVMESDEMTVAATAAEEMAVPTMATQNEIASGIVVPNEPCYEVASIREDSVERFAINAKPYQNVYSSNHFLEHFFGDRNDKRDHVVDGETSTSLSSSDQPEYVDEMGEEIIIMEQNDITYPTFENDLNTSINDLDLDGHIDCTAQNEHSETNDELNEKTHVDPNGNGIEHKSDHEANNHMDRIQLLDIESEQSRAIETDAKFEMKIQRSEQIEFDEIEGNKLVLSIEDDTELSLGDELMQKQPIEKPIEALPVIDINCTFIESLNEFSDDTSTETPCDNTNYMTNENYCKIDTVSIVNGEEKLDGINEPIVIAAETKADTMETTDSEPTAGLAASSNQSVKSNSSSNGRPWLRIVDTQTLEQEKKIQQTFPITSAVSMWLQAQKEKTPEPVLRVPNYRNFLTSATAAAAAMTASTKRTKTDSQTSHSNSSIDLTEETASITSDKFHINDDEEEDIMNFWESPILSSSSPQSPTPPPIYNSVYGSSINYTNLLSNKNELLCNNIVDFDGIDAVAAAAATANGKPNDNETTAANDKATTKLKNGCNQNAADTVNGKIGNGATATTTTADEEYYRPPPEVCCTIM